VIVDIPLRKALVAMGNADLALRNRLADQGTLIDGYHPEMRALHEANADRLALAIADYGWPGQDRVGADGSAAAWLIVQHAISRPVLMRQVRDLLRGSGAVPAARWAMLDDRIAVFEGRKQTWGTQFDWDDSGEMNPLPIADPDGVDARRAAVGLPPLAEAIARHRTQAEGPPADYARHRAGAEAFAREVGWR
jgi:hypothetical protein